MVIRKRKVEAEDPNVKRLCRTIDTMMHQMTATNTALQNQTALYNNLQYNTILPNAPEAVAPAPVSRCSSPMAGPSMAGPSSAPSSGPSLPLGQPQLNQADYQEDLEEEEEEDRGYFLFSLAQKYGLTWAIKGDAPLVQSELGRPSAVTSLDKMLLTPGAGIDIMSYLNNHLKVPALDSVPDDFEAVITQAPRRSKPLTTTGYKPIPMARYTSPVAPMASVLDANLASPVASFLPKPLFPGTLSTSRFLVLASLEGVTALNILHLLPRSALPEDRAALTEHITSIFYAIMRKSAENVGTTVRQVRFNQLGGVPKATREELVYQPIMGECLYTDDKKVGLAAQPPSRGRFVPRGARRGWTGAAPQTPSSGGFQPQRENSQGFAPAGRRARPPSYGRNHHRGGRGGRRGRR